MPYNAPSLSNLIAQTQQDIEQRLPGSWPQVREKTLEALAYAQAGLASGVHEHLSWVARQIIANEADEAELLKHCQFWGVKRKQASRAGGSLTVTVYAAVTIPANTRWQRPDGAIFTNAEPLSTDKAGNFAVTVAAVNAGIEGNTPKDTPLTLVTPLDSVQAQATTSGIVGGADIESVGELLARLEFRVQYPPGGGTQHDYERWARECAGVTRAWCLPTWKGQGTVGVAFVLDGNEDIFPSPADVKRVDDYISGHNDPVTGQLVGKPLGPIVTTFALTPRPVDMTIRISPSNDETKMAVKKALVALFYNESKPAGSIIPSHINRAIAGVSGLVDFELISPTGISYAGAEELLTVGAITWR
ncbi:TPA: baseplate J/gp47 family protein [Serratia marcescens]|uniref:baseplate J/gp47 family protein n=1 Tax=Serratia TaxID=613 RepID=UPI001A23DD8F|nr:MULTISPECIES: baseplate J/gp47 family protein [Serratia]EMB4112117.1 baseplate J/gp47 family protein [Serratia marcescens]MDP8611961.1 baseplate J/gp47 family protein [Serratia marcescens]MDP8617060.1 baseplate J/gp47 family protein [Serratia marcescens]MDP8647240.1 baseplate J/gp47 family protein [Serratia marcescens]MDP8657088.1 baseplate J/gp47 family protein [Serratia marcescens]